MIFYDLKYLTIRYTLFLNNFNIYQTPMPVNFRKIIIIGKNGQIQQKNIVSDTLLIFNIQLNILCIHIDI